jgi:hypothetical protein
LLAEKERDLLVFEVLEKHRDDFGSILYAAYRSEDVARPVACETGDPEGPPTPQIERKHAGERPV